MGSRILVACSADGVATARRLLGTEFDVECETTLEGAVQRLAKGGIAAVLCTLQFDESRMFELLDRVLADSRTKDVPFIGLRFTSSRLPVEVVTVALDTAVKRGAVAGIDYLSEAARLGQQPALEHVIEFIRKTAEPPA